MEYRVVEIYWVRNGTPEDLYLKTFPIVEEHAELTEALNQFDREGWQVGDLHHEINDGLCLSTVTLTRG